jgi:hypothetical protein
VRSDTEPFIRYLNVFRSRLGLANLVLSVTSLGRTPDKVFQRRLRQALESRVDIDIAQDDSHVVLEYLSEKSLMSSKARGSGRYKGYSLEKLGEEWHADRDGVPQSTLPVAQTDIWLADPRVPSTIGAPTVDNVDEVVGLATQLHVIDRSKFAWTITGQSITALRSLQDSKLTDSEANPFVLGIDAPILLRSLLEEDGRLMLPLIEFIVRCGSNVKRDTVADAMPDITENALNSQWPTPLAGESLKLGRETLEALRGAPKGGTGPGVREHRTSPRLEWLTDLGYLSKSGLPRNSFEYRVTPQLEDLARSLRRSPIKEPDWPFVSALDAWRRNTHWQAQRELAHHDSPDAAFFTAYRLLKRPIGPASLREVAFLTGMFYSDWSSSTVITDVIELVQSIPGGSLTGGRFGRAPESVYLSDEALRRMRAIE